MSRHPEDKNETRSSLREQQRWGKKRKMDVSAVWRALNGLFMSERKRQPYKHLF
jgi:hypothetical protein